MKKIITVVSEELKLSLKDNKDIILLYPLKDFAVGYSVYYDIQEIDDYVLVNRLLNDDELDQLALLLKTSHIKGIVFDDLGVLEIINDLKITKILLLDHLATNSRSINYYLDYVDSVVVSSDLNYKEIENITKMAKKKVVLYVFGLKKLMYSRRKLLSNYHEYYNLKAQEKEKASINDKSFIIKEDNFGTSFYMGQYYNGLSLSNLDNILYCWYDLIDLDLKTCQEIILANEVNIPSTKGFLDVDVYFKIRGQNND